MKSEEEIKERIKKLNDVFPSIEEFSPYEIGLLVFLHAKKRVWKELKSPADEDLLEESIQSLRSEGYVRFSNGFYEITEDGIDLLFSFIYEEASQ